jgi:succinyl-diaminopimelate desuccinylase
VPAGPERTGVHEATLDLVRRLIACRSITPADDGCLDLIGSRLAAAGFACERIDRGRVGNLWARHGRSGPVVCLAGHVDVVPPGPVERWTSDPFAAAERDGYLYGRGAADMKTSVAAMVTAAERVAAAQPHHPGTIAVLLTTDEEGDAVDGTAAVVERLRSRGETIEYCLLGEPTSSARLGDTIKNGRRGSLTGTLAVRGVQCHIAYPEQGRNPIHEAVPALAALVSTTWDGGNGDFPPTSFQIASVRAGTGASNVVPGTLEVVFNFRFSPESPADLLQARVRQLLDAQGLDYGLAWAPVSQPFLTPPGRLIEAVRASVRQVAGVEPALSTGGGTSDGRFLAAVSREVVEFGPVNSSIHAIDEHVRLADVGPLSEVYEGTVTRLLAG